MDTEKWKSVLVPVPVYREIKAIAGMEDRSISGQLRKIFKEWKHQYLLLNDGTIDLNSKEGEKLADIAMNKAIASFANYEVNDTTYDANKWIHADHLEVANEIGDLKYKSYRYNLGTRYI